MSAAVAGGVTCLACPPDTDPPLDEPGLVEMLKHRARSLNQAHVHPVGALTVGLKGADLTEMGELAEAGCIAFSQADAPLVDTQVLLRAMQYAATFGHRVWLRPQDAHLARTASRTTAKWRRASGSPRSRRPPRRSRWRRSSRSSAKPARACTSRRLSTADGVAMVRAAKKDELPVTCDVAVHHLHLCDIDIGWFDAQCRLVPPLRGTRDRAALRAGLADGTIDLVCSDHTPVDDDAKQLPFAEAEPGATGLELLLPLTLKWASADKVALPAALARITAHPAAVLGTRCRASRRRSRGRRVRVRPECVLDGRAGEASEPGQEHAVPRARGSRAGQSNARGGSDRL